jgi:2-phosphosulfolactate phosphatase
MTWYSQRDSQIRFEWGLQGAQHLLEGVDVAIVVDVLSFSTCVEIGVTAGAEILPFHFKDERAESYAASMDALCAATQRSKTMVSLSPGSLKGLSPGDRVVLPSPNGSTISFSLETTKVLCGCLRNAAAVARAAQKIGKRILVIAAGEKWPDTSLRPSIEDMIGAGAVISHLSGTLSVEAKAAAQVFQSSRDDLLSALLESSSGRELTERGYPEDIEIAACLNVSATVPILKNKAFLSLRV